MLALVLVLAVVVGVVTGITNHCCSLPTLPIEGPAEQDLSKPLFTLQQPDRRAVTRRTSHGASEGRDARVEGSGRGGVLHGRGADYGHDVSVAGAGDGADGDGDGAGSGDGADSGEGEGDGDGDGEGEWLYRMTLAKDFGDCLRAKNPGGGRPSPLPSLLGDAAWCLEPAASQFLSISGIASCGPRIILTEPHR